MPYESCGLNIAVSLLCTGFLRTTSAQETWFDVVTGIAPFLVLFGFGSIWEGLASEKCLEVPNITWVLNPAGQSLQVKDQ